MSVTIANVTKTTYSLPSMQSEKGLLLDVSEVYDSDGNDFVPTCSHTRYKKLQRTRPCWATTLRKGLCVFVITILITYYLRFPHGISPFFLLECITDMTVLMVRLCVDREEPIPAPRGSPTLPVARMHSCCLRNPLQSRSPL